MTENVQNKGSVTFFVKHPHSDWSTNVHGYKFPVVQPSGTGISVSVRKNSDLTVEIDADGPLGKKHHFKAPMPPCGAKGLHVGLTWELPNKITLYLNGKPVQSATDA